MSLDTGTAPRGRDVQRATACAIVIGALTSEMRAVKQLLGDVREEQHPKHESLAYVGRLEGKHLTWRVAVLASQQTEADAAVLTERAISWFDPDVALFVGVAGGIKDVRAGDVVAADSVDDVEYGKAWSDKYEARPKQFHGSHGLISRARFSGEETAWRRRIIVPNCEVPLNSEPTVHIEPISTGKKVLAGTEGEIYERVRAASPRAVAYDMEGTGFAAAIDKTVGVRGLVVRGVSDMLKDKGDPLDPCRQLHAAARAAAFAMQVLHDLRLSRQGG
jgi:nucleoside phosphorylase